MKKADDVPLRWKLNNGTREIKQEYLARDHLSLRTIQRNPRENAREVLIILSSKNKRRTSGELAEGSSTEQTPKSKHLKAFLRIVSKSQPHNES